MNCFSYAVISALAASVCCVVSPVSIASSAYAPQAGKAEQAAATLEELVVTGTRTDRLALYSPIRVDVVNHEQIEQLHASELVDVLETVGGINIRQITGKDGREAWLQGISANRVLVLINGEPLSASTGSAVDITQISVADIQRVEVVKGATSALYGSAAMGGVINVITREEADGLEFGLSADVGSYGSQNPSDKAYDLTRQRLRANVAHGGETLQVRSSVNARVSDGFQADPDAWSQQGADGHKINTELGLLYQPDDASEYALRYENYQQKQHTRLLGFTPPNNWAELDKYDDAERHHLAARGRWQIANHEIFIRAFAERYINESRPDGSFTREAQFDSAKLAGQWNGQLGENHLLTAGVDIFQETLNQKKYEAGGTVLDELGSCKRAERDSLEAYLQDDLDLAGWNLLPGIRWQHDSGFGHRLTPKINAYKPLWQTGDNSMAMRFGLGRGYRVPNLKERCYEFDHSHLGYRISGNENLKPEIADSLQVSWIFRQYGQHDFELGLFYNRLKDLIETRHAGNDAGIAIYQYQNIDRAETRGVELNWRWTSDSFYQLRNAYTFLQAEDKTTGERLPERPRHQLKSVLTLDLSERLEMLLSGRWQSAEAISGSSEKSPAWAGLDLRFTQSLSDTTSLYGGIDNLGNTQRDFAQEYDRRPVQGRLVYIGFSLQY